MYNNDIIEDNIIGDNMVFAITSIIFFFLVMIIVVPYSIEIKINVNYDEAKRKLAKVPNTDNYVIWRLFNIIPVYKLNINEAEKKIEKFRKYIEGKVAFKKIAFRLLKKIKCRKFVMMLGFNLGDVIVNSYVNAMLNSIICMYINYKQDNFDLKKLYYQIQITENPLILNFHCIFNIKIVDTIKEIIAENKETKKGKEEIKTFKKRSDLYGRTSN